MGNASRYLGIALVLIGVLLFTNIIPVGSTPQTVCAQSIVSLVTICAPPSSYVDSISYGDKIIAPVLNNNPVQVFFNSGTLKAYYFLASGATLSSYSASYCSGLGCTPNQLLSVSKASTSSGILYLTATAPSMLQATYYVYQFSITDSVGTKSSLSGTVVIIPSSFNFLATVTTLNGTYTIGQNPLGTIAASSGVNVYSDESPSFQVAITSNAEFVSSVQITVQPTGTVFTLSRFTSTIWRGYINFQPGIYTVTGTISNSAVQTAFSIRVTSFSRAPATLSKITLTSVGTFTITDTYTGVNGQTTTITDVCKPESGCTGTTTIASSGSSTTITNTQSQTTTTVGSGLGGLGFGLGQVGGFLLIIVGGIFAFRKGKR